MPNSHGICIVIPKAMKIARWIFMTILVVLILQVNHIAQAATVRISWLSNTESDLAGYKVYYGPVSHNYSLSKDVGLALTTDIAGLSNGTTYYLAVTAYDSSGNESAYSQEVQAVIPEAGGAEPAPADTDADGIPDNVEILWGLDPSDPLDSIQDLDGDGVVNLVEYMANTDPRDFSSRPATDNILRDFIGVVDEPIDLSALNPSGNNSIVPLISGTPEVANNALDIAEPGVYLYNVFNQNGTLVYRLRVSVTSHLFSQGSFTPGTPLSLEDLTVGISIQLTADAILRNVPIGIGNSSLEPSSVIAYDGGNGVEFAVLPYGLALATPATVTVTFDKSNPLVQRYDENEGTWKNISNVTVSGTQVSFSTQELGKFRIYSEESSSAITSVPGSSSASGGGGGGGGCFISTAQL
jgi:hypothetical protein